MSLVGRQFCFEMAWKCLFIGCQGLITSREKESWGNIRAGGGWSCSGQNGVSIWVALLLIHSALLWLHCQETFSLARDDPPLPVVLPQLPLHTDCKVPPLKSKGWRHGQATAELLRFNLQIGQGNLDLCSLWSALSRATKFPVGAELLGCLQYKSVVALGGSAVLSKKKNKGLSIKP